MTDPSMAPMDLQVDTQRSWADLPVELATVVLLNLPPRYLDRVRFGAVCRQWRAAAQEKPALPPHFPWIALPDLSFYSLPGSAFQPLPVHLDGHRQRPLAQSSCSEWLVFEHKDGALTLMSPFSAAAATMVLPGLHTLCDRHKPGMEGPTPTIRKLVVCSDDLVAATVVQESRTVPWRTGTGVLRLALCRPGASSWSWALTSFPYTIIKDLHDIVLYKGHLYALNMDRALFALFVSNKRGVRHEPVVSRVRRVIDTNHPTRTPFKAAPPFYLLESHGTLLLIYKRGVLDGKKRKRRPLPCSVDSDMANKFVVFVADFERFRWKRAGCNTELRRAVPDDRVLFLGPWCSRSLAITQDHQDMGYINMGGNSIVFFSDEDETGSADEYHRKRVPFYCSVYDIKTRRSQSLLQMSVRPWKGFHATWMFPPSQMS